MKLLVFGNERDMNASEQKVRDYQNNNNLNWMNVVERQSFFNFKDKSAPENVYIHSDAQSNDCHL